MKSTKPFLATIKTLLEIEGISERELTRRMARKGDVRNNSTWNRLYTGESRVLPDHMKAIARALNIAPEAFAEYRLWMARRPYDPSEIGWNAAIRNLQRLEQAEAPDDEEELAPAEIADHLEETRADEAAGGSA